MPASSSARRRVSLGVADVTSGSVLRRVARPALAGAKTHEPAENPQRPSVPTLMCSARLRPRLRTTERRLTMFRTLIRGRPTARLLRTVRCRTQRELLEDGGTIDRRPRRRALHRPRLPHSVLADGGRGQDEDPRTGRRGAKGRPRRLVQDRARDRVGSGAHDRERRRGSRRRRDRGRHARAWLGGRTTGRKRDPSAVARQPRARC